MAGFLDLASAWIVAFMDLLLGWTLHLPQDAVLILLAVATSAILTFSRLITTDQHNLKLCDQDKARVKGLLRQAQGRKDTDAIQRFRATLGMIGLRALRAEGKPLLFSLLPIVFLATWACARLAFVPPVSEEKVLVRAHLPVTAIDSLVHLVPTAGVRCSNGWIQKVKESVGADGKTVTGGVAVWEVSADARPSPYALEIRFGDKTVAKSLVVDGRHFAIPLETYEGQDIEAVVLVMPKFRLFGIVPGVEKLFLDPWIIAYLLLAIPSVLLLKRVFRIY